MTLTQREILWACSLILAVFLCLTIQRNAVWLDALTLWKDVIAKSPNSAGGHLNVGLAHYYNGNKLAAIVEYQKAAQIAAGRINENSSDIRSRNILALAQSDLAVIAMEEKDLVFAERSLRGALSILPSFFPAGINLAEVLIAQRRYAEAVTVLDQAMVYGRQSSFGALGDDGIAKLYQLKGIALTELGYCELANQNFAEAALRWRESPPLACTQ